MKVSLQVSLCWFMVSRRGVQLQSLADCLQIKPGLPLPPSGQRCARSWTLTAAPLDDPSPEPPVRDVMAIVWSLERQKHMHDFNRNKCES